MKEVTLNRVWLLLVNYCNQSDKKSSKRLKKISMKNHISNENLLGDRLLKLRGRSPRREFAAKYGIHEQTLLRYENGLRIPDNNFIRKVAEGEGVEFQWLLTGKAEFPTVGHFSLRSNLQPTENIKNINTDLSNVGQGTAISDESLTLRCLRLADDNASLLRQNGDLRVEVERQKARIAELERQITEGAREAGDEALARLELENRQLREENRVLKRGSIVLAPETDRVQGRPPE